VCTTSSPAPACGSSTAAQISTYDCGTGDIGSPCGSSCNYYAPVGNEACR
jgi:hypothetical protein